MPYLLELTTDEQKARWLPKVATGESIVAIAMTEPGAGSDLAGIRTKAVRDGDHYVVDGAKTFITNGINADLVITAVRTGDHPHKGLSLLVVEEGTPGFSRGRNLEKVGMHVQDTAELIFENCRVPAANLIGNEGEGFFGLTNNLPQERLSIAVLAIAGAHQALEWTKQYVRDRKAFGNPLGSLQTVKHRLADLVTEVEITQVYIDQCILALNEGKLSVADAAKAKLWADRGAGPGRRRVRPDARRLRLHARVPDRARLHRQPDPADLRRCVGDHARDHRPFAGLGVAPSSDCTANCARSMAKMQRLPGCSVCDHSSSRAGQ